MAERAAVSDGNSSLSEVHPAADLCPSVDTDPRMTLYQQREDDFFDFVKQSNGSMDNDSGTDVKSAEDMPLSGLQCLLTLTEILDRAAQLRVANFDLEQRIEVLQKFKLLAEVSYVGVRCLTCHVMVPEYEMLLIGTSKLKDGIFCFCRHLGTNSKYPHCVILPKSD